MKGILGKKLGMTSIFTEEGNRVPVTVIQAGPCTITDVRTEAKNGYSAIQIGFVSVDKHRVIKPVLGQFDKNKMSPLRYLKELRVSPTDAFTVGQEIKVDIFNVGEKVDVIGTSIGKGFAGAMKRWNFNGGCGSHGSKVHRRPCSAGATDGARTFRGKRSPGHMGACSSTTQNLEVVKILPDKNLILLKGAIPGSPDSLVMLRETVKKKMKRKHKIKGTAQAEQKVGKSMAKKTIKKKI